MATPSTSQCSKSGNILNKLGITYMRDGKFVLRTHKGKVMRWGEVIVMTQENESPPDISTVPIEEFKLKECEHVFESTEMQLRSGDEATTVISNCTKCGINAKNVKKEEREVTDEEEAEFVDLANELLEHKFTKYVPYYVEASILSNPELAIRTKNAIKKVLAKGDDKRIARTRMKLKTLICSVNDLDDNDVHPYGVHLSIYLQSKKTQSLLNVNHLTTQNKDQGAGPEIPDINYVYLYKHARYNWIRVWLTNLECIESIVKELEGMDMGYVKYCVIHDKIVEFYYTSNKNLEMLQYFNKNDHVRKIIFASNCKSMKLFLKQGKIKAHEFIDNLTAFFYCYRTESTVLDSAHMVDLGYLYVLAVIYVYIDSMNDLKNDMFTPIHASTGQDPIRTLRYHAAKAEPMSLGDSFIMKNLVKAGENRKRPIFEYMTDRELRIIGLGSNIGGVNFHEDVVIPDKFK